MFLRAIPVIALVTSLSACGGSSDGSAVNPVPPPIPTPTPTQSATVLKTFSDGSGVLRDVSTTNGFTLAANLLAGDIQSVANAINAGQQVSTDPISQTYQFSDAYGNFYTGQANVNGQLVDIIYYEDATATTAILYGTNGTRNVLVAGGEKASNIPSGTYIYRGTNVIADRGGVYGENGTFTMNVNFDTRQAAISGSTSDGVTIGSSISGTGIAVDNTNGTFASNNIAIDVGGGPIQGTINGNFHGAGAVGVTGIYHDNLPNPLLAGAIAGTR